MCTGKICLELKDRTGVVKPGNNITRGCTKGARIKGKEWSVPYCPSHIQAYLKDAISLAYY